MSSVTERAKRAWDVFRGRDPTSYQSNLGPSYSKRPDKVRMVFGGDRSIVNAVYNRIAIDVAAVNIEHVKKNKDGFYKETLNTSLNDCLTLSANIDQTGRALIQDLVLSMFDEGVVAVVPTLTNKNIKSNDNYKIYELRTGKITQWYPKHVRVEIYDEETGRKREALLPKKSVAIIENPFYSVMNEPNSIGRRLISKLNLLDVIDEQLSAGKLDMIVQLPYDVKSPMKRHIAEERRKDLQTQLNDSTYGVAYVGATEKIVQLNRPLENNLMTQIEYLTNMFYSELGICEEILKGTADEKMQLNYRNNVLEPVLSAITQEMTRKWISPTAITQGQSIFFIQNPFKLVPVNSVAEMADKLTRAMVLSTNEVRSIVGYKPVDDDRANQLRNPNLNASEQELMDPLSTDGAGYDQDSMDDSSVMNINQDEQDDQDDQEIEKKFQDLMTRARKNLRRQNN